MNLVQRQIFGTKKGATSWNTEIGGVSSIITSASSLASRLGISASNILNFTIDGSDIKCNINVSYSVVNFGVLISPSLTGLTHYRDNGGKVTSIGYQAFYGSNLSEGYFPIATSIGSGAFDNNIGGSLNKLKFLYVPTVISIGATIGNDNVFRSGNLNGGVIYAHPSLQTINSGGVEGDLAYLSGGNTIRYITNNTAPNTITDLSSGYIYNTGIQLNFTPPSSTNTIEYYEIYINGVLNSQRLTASGQQISGLSVNTSYQIQLKAVDVFYNKSTLSNTLSVTTANLTPLANFKNRILADGGSLIDETYLASEYSKITSNSLESYLLFWYNYKSGIKKNGSDLVEKMYSFSGESTDIIQETTANKPTYTAGGITFDSTDELTRTLKTSISNKTFSVSWRVKSTPGNYYPLIGFGDWNTFRIHSASGGLIYAGITVANRFVLSSGNFLTNTDATYTFTYNSVTKNANIYRDTTFLSSKTMVDPANFTSVIINAISGNQTFYDSKLFSKELTLTEITNIL